MDDNDDNHRVNHEICYEHTSKIDVCCEHNCENDENHCEHNCENDENHCEHNCENDENHCEYNYQNNCENHEFETDLFDLGQDRSQVVTYCIKCFFISS
jgi:hypothetical protein